MTREATTSTCTRPRTNLGRSGVNSSKRTAGRAGALGPAPDPQRCSGLGSAAGRRPSPPWYRSRWSPATQGETIVERSLPTRWTSPHWFGGSLGRASGRRFRCHVNATRLRHREIGRRRPNGVQMIRFHALGGLTVTDEQRDEVGIGGPRQRRLLAMLLIHRNSVVSVDRLADAVFAGDPTPAASTTLRSYVARTRRLLDGAESGTVGGDPGTGVRAPGAGRGVRRHLLRALGRRRRLATGARRCRRCVIGPSGGARPVAW